MKDEKRAELKKEWDEWQLKKMEINCKCDEERANRLAKKAEKRRINRKKRKEKRINNPNFKSGYELRIEQIMESNSISREDAVIEIERRNEEKKKKRLLKKQPKKIEIQPEDLRDDKLYPRNWC